MPINKKILPEKFIFHFISVKTTIAVVGMHREKGKNELAMDFALSK